MERDGNTVGHAQQRPQQVDSLACFFSLILVPFLRLPRCHASQKALQVFAFSARIVQCIIFPIVVCCRRLLCCVGRRSVATTETEGSHAKSKVQLRLRPFFGSPCLYFEEAHKDHQASCKRRRSDGAACYSGGSCVSCAGMSVLPKNRL